MGIYERIEKLYEEERARQQRETEVLRAASRVADALRDHGVKAADAPIRGWLIHRRIRPRLTTPSPPPTTPSPSARTRPRQGFIMPNPVPRPYTVTQSVAQSMWIEYHLGVDGRIYDDGKPIEHPSNATIDAIEQYLAEIVVKNHLAAELFRDDDTQS
jgi:hypothetical protein